MKIVFDNEEQKEEFMRHGQCPTLIDSNAIEFRGCEDSVGSDYCITCWENCGIDLAVVTEPEVKTYKIKLEGCDDETEFDMQLTEEEFNLLKRVSEKANETSTYRCMPRMYIMEVTDGKDESDI